MLMFYVCEVCGNLVMKIEDGGNTPFCCGQNMTALKPKTTDSGSEKHLPIINSTPLSSHASTYFVSVGSTRHPSEENHYIKWIVLETSRGSHICHLDPGDEPRAAFVICDDEEVYNVYAYCNIHGLWMS